MCLTALALALVVVVVVVQPGGSLDEWEYELEGDKIMTEFLNSTYLVVRCEKDTSLESPAPPSDCPPGEPPGEPPGKPPPLSLVLLAARCGCIAEGARAAAPAALLAPAAPPWLRALELSSADVQARLDAAALESLALVRWAPANVTALQRCGSLRALLLLELEVDSLPGGWVEECPLQRLVVERAQRLGALPAGLLRGAGHLQYLALRHGALAALPAGLLDDAAALRTLDLTGNRLRTLPSASFWGPIALRALVLASNDLAAQDMFAVESLHALAALSLANNSRIGDLCANASKNSPFVKLTKLRTLRLSDTSVSLICWDWRQTLTRLTTLDLRGSNVSKLWYWELKEFTRASEAGGGTVLLQGAPVGSVRFRASDLSGALRPPTVAVRLDPLLCDCHMYLTRLALERSPAVLPASMLRCAPHGRPLAALPPDELQCRTPGECRVAKLPRKCECTARPYNASGTSVLVSVRCPDDLDALGALRPYHDDHMYRLRLENRHFRNLSVAELPPSVVELDLRNASLSRVDASTAAALRRARPAVRLAGNPIDCTCGGAALLGALGAGGATLLDEREAACEGGAALALALRCDPCGPRLPLGARLALALAALLATAAAVAAYLAPPERRLALKRRLRGRGLLPAARERTKGCTFDAFVSYAPSDEEAAREMVRRLERGAMPYRLCVPERDFTAGALVAAQTEAAVRRSRRTVALVSRALAARREARAELRAARACELRDGTPRVLLVLLEEPAALPMDAELRRYCSEYVSLRWRDPSFWDLLRATLPPPLAAAPAARTSRTFLPNLWTLWKS